MLFSIITVCYNAEKIIRDTVQSALNQSCTDYEIIVKDGISKDNTLQMIPKSEKVRIVSKKDNGIYDAMNQAIEVATGDYLIFMNCGDAFANIDVLQYVKEKLEHNSIDILYGNYIVDSVLRCQPEKLNGFYLYRTPLCHQSMIVRKQLFEEVGMYDCKYRILADYDFTLKSWKMGRKFLHLELPVCTYLGGGVSESAEGIEIKEKERKEILKKNYSLGERIKYNLILVCSLRKLRIWLMSGNAPEWFEKMYRRMANKMNS